jgi:regulatory protein YycI of two-component signal transduction system YycFG
MRCKLTEIELHERDRLLVQLKRARQRMKQITGLLLKKGQKFPAGEFDKLMNEHSNLSIKEQHLYEHLQKTYHLSGREINDELKMIQLLF